MPAKTIKTSQKTIVFACFLAFFVRFERGLRSFERMEPCDDVFG
jgi:hypothetical protein